MIVVGTDDPSAVSRIQIFEYSEEVRKWQNIQNIVGVVFDPVHDVAFAPNLGRSVCPVEPLARWNQVYCSLYIERLSLSSTLR